MGSQVHPIDRIFNERERSQGHPIDRIFDEKEAALAAQMSDQAGNFDPSRPPVDRARLQPLDLGAALNAGRFAIQNEAFPAAASLVGMGVGSLPEAIPAIGAPIAYVTAPTGATVAAHFARGLQDQVTTPKFKNDVLAARQASPQMYDLVAGGLGLIGAKPAKLKDLAEAPVQKFVSGAGQGAISKVVGDALNTRTPIVGAWGAIDAGRPEDTALDYVAEALRSGALAVGTTPNALGQYMGSRQVRGQLADQKAARRAIDEVFLSPDQKQIASTNLSIEDPLNTGGVNIPGPQSAAEGPAGKAPGMLQLLDYLSTRDSSGQIAKRRGENLDAIKSNINEALALNPDAKPEHIREEALSQFDELQSAADQEAQMFRTTAERQSQAQRALEAQRAQKLRAVGGNMANALEGKTAEEIRNIRSTAEPLAEATLSKGLETAAELRTKGATNNAEVLRRQAESERALADAKQGVENVKSEVRQNYGTNALKAPQEVARAIFAEERGAQKESLQSLYNKLPNDLPLKMGPLLDTAMSLQKQGTIDPTGTLDKVINTLKLDPTNKASTTARSLTFKDLHDMSTMLRDTINDLTVRGTGGSTSTIQAKRLADLDNAISDTLYGREGDAPIDPTHPLKVYRDAYKVYAKDFRHDTAGKLFQRGDRGGEHAVYPENTLELALGSGADRKDAEQFSRVLSRSPEGRQAMSDYLSARVSNEIGDTATPQALEKWRGANEHILDQVPEFKAAFKVLQGRVENAHSVADRILATHEANMKMKAQASEGEAAKVEKLAGAQSTKILSSAEQQALALEKASGKQIKSIRDKTAEKVSGRQAMLEKVVSSRDAEANRKAVEVQKAAEKAKAEHPLKPFVDRENPLDYKEAVGSVMRGDSANSKAGRLLQSVSKNPNAREAVLNAARENIREAISTKSFGETGTEAPTAEDRNFTKVSLGRGAQERSHIRNLMKTLFGEGSPEIKTVDQAFAQMNALSRTPEVTNSATQSRGQIAGKVEEAMRGSLLQSIARHGVTGKSAGEILNVLEGIWGTSPSVEGANRILTEGALDVPLLKELLKPIDKMSPDRIKKVKGLIAPYIAPRVPTEGNTPALTPDKKDEQQ